MCNFSMTQTASRADTWECSFFFLPPLCLQYKWPFPQNLATIKHHRDRSHCRLPHHKGRLSANCNHIQSSAAVLRLEWHTNCFSTTHSESVPRPNSEYKDGRDCPLVNENGSGPYPFRGVKEAPSGLQSCSLFACFFFFKLQYMWSLSSCHFT